MSVAIGRDRLGNRSHPSRSTVASARVTHIFVTENLSAKKAQHYLEARRKNGTKLVTPEWAIACAERGKRVSEAKYAAPVFNEVRSFSRFFFTSLPLRVHSHATRPDVRRTFGTHSSRNRHTHFFLARRPRRLPILRTHHHRKHPPLCPRDPAPAHGPATSRQKTTLRRSRVVPLLDEHPNRFPLLRVPSFQPHPSLPSDAVHVALSQPQQQQQQQPRPRSSSPRSKPPRRNDHHLAVRRPRLQNGNEGGARLGNAWLRVLGVGKRGERRKDNGSRRRRRMEWRRRSRRRR